jgi:hypothetical protein
MALEGCLANDAAPRCIEVLTMMALQVPTALTISSALPTVAALWRALSARWQHRRPGPRGLTRKPPAEVDTDLPLGCGWFDSSYDLVSGLQMQELATPESLAAELPLAFWLEVEAA